MKKNEDIVKVITEIRNEAYNKIPISFIEKIIEIEEDNATTLAPSQKQKKIKDYIEEHKKEIEGGDLSV